MQCSAQSLSSKTVLKAFVLGEDEREVARLERAYLRRYSPRSEVEREEVLELMSLMLWLWRLDRIKVELLDLHGHENTRQNGKDSFEFAGIGWAFAHDNNKARSLLAASANEDRHFRRYLQLIGRLDAQLQERLDLPTCALAGSGIAAN